mmetsp:Transcript_8021/g.24368  ORF Transcript_8021/g.24368 Transcript_8021/m.24368 type:complete len:575 (+) Transcript_8021:2-1726(+)
MPPPSVAVGGAPVTKWRNPPLPQQALPEDPCSGISYDAGTKSKGCTPRASPQCFNLQNKFLSIQVETVDKRDDLLDEIATLEESCAQTKRTLEGEIQMYTTQLADEHTKLADSTSGENTAAEEGQLKSSEHTQLKKQMLESRTSCSSKFRTLESELCALRKIRAELFKMEGDKHAFFQDCEVGDWTSEDCSVSCGGGSQTLRREVVVPASGGGSPCPPLKQTQRCGDQPCPIDCKLSEWSGWSACSAECGGGVTERTRRVEVHPRYDGTPCGDAEETAPCNIQACDQDCELAPWSQWSNCSKACDSGTRTRRRNVAKPAVGRGHCAHKNDDERLERQPCNEQACMRSPDKPLICKSKVDVVLLLDGSGSVGSSGWAATKEFAKKFVQAFDGPNTDAQVSVILFSGPYAWPDMKKCAGQSGTGDLDMEKTCKIKIVQHFSDDMVATGAKIEGLEWPRGTTLTSSALGLAKAELMTGRNGAERIVIVVTDGIPLSRRLTKRAAEAIKEDARLMFAAVKLSTRGLRYMISWGSGPTEENVLKVDSFQSLESMDTVDTLVADMCRNVEMPTMPTMTTR